MTTRVDPRSIGGRKGAYRRWSTAEPGEGSAQGRRGQAGFRARFLKEIDPDGTMPEAERERRVTLAVKAWMADLTLRRMRTRRAREAAQAAKEPAA